MFPEGVFNLQNLLIRDAVSGLTVQYSAMPGLSVWQGGISMKRAAIISAIIENPHETQREFNSIISEYSDIVRGRMGIPFGKGRLALVSLTVVAELDRINSLTGRLGKVPGVSVKASIAKEGLNLEED